ncbi:uncharacterized protein PgNI_09074, partial [Pyricularia grisea]|uniref:Uncharacterized protein n=1 Tax=Pyricularia grisea TaxID=148305 RepID=A0A6P8ARL5_PYRGI
LGVFVLRMQFSHPLAQYPGPLLARFTNLYAAYHAWRGTLHTDIYRCHQKYGKIWAPERLTADGEEILATDVHSRGENCTKSKAYRALVHGAVNTLTATSHKEHGWRGRILSLAFSDAQAQSYQEILLRNIDLFCNNLQESIGTGPTDMAKECDALTFDVTCEVVFGTRWNALVNHKYRSVTKAIEASNVRVSTRVQSTALTVERLDKYLFPRAIEGRGEFLGFIGSVLSMREKGPSTNTGNIFSFLENAKDPESGNGRMLSPVQLRAECATLIAAGSDTSSTTLAATLYYLAANPAAYRRAQAETLQAFPGISSEIELRILKRACIDEALRMSPPVGGALWREVGPGGITVDGLHLREGIDVGTGIYSLHHSEVYHRQPFSYLPERWLGGGAWTKVEMAQARAAFVPFSVGPRGCVGKGLAYHELMLALAKVLHRVDFRHADDHEAAGEYLLSDHVTGAKTGPFLVFSSSRV